MRLKNKKTGEIVEVFNNTVGIFPDSLTKLCEDWEDVPEEPETYYYISDCVNIESSTNDHGHNMPEEIWHKAMKRRIEVGNYFETKEEAEKAVEKLKALVKAKRDGLRFSGWHYNDDGLVILANTNKIDDSILETLFGEKV